MVVRTYDEEQEYIERVNSHKFKIKKGFVPNMKVDGYFYVNKRLESLMFQELQDEIAQMSDHLNFRSQMFESECHI